MFFNNLNVKVQSLEGAMWEKKGLQFSNPCAHFSLLFLHGTPWAL